MRTREPNLTDEQKLFIKENSSNRTAKQIAKSLNRKCWTIWSHLKRNGIEVKPQRRPRRMQMSKNVVFRCEAVNGKTWII